VAFSIGRALGSAPRRNRLRRRLRALLHELEPSLLPGALLIGALPATIELTFDQLRSELLALMTAARAIEVAGCNA
jgi:ribonuclease P protein component